MRIEKTYVGISLKDLDELHLRLIGEFARALSQLEQKFRDRDIPSQGAKIIKVAVADWTC